MSLNLNPWVALLLGILIGWILQWLLEVWFFRRRRLECQRRLAQVEAQLKEREEELRQARRGATAPEAELATKVAAAPPSVAVAVEAPAVQVEAPKAEIGGAGLAAAAGLAGAALGAAAEEGKADIAAPSIQVKAPEIEARLPALELGAPQMEAKLPEVGFEVPEVELPKVAAEVPAVELPKVEAKAIGAAAIAADDLTLIKGIGSKFAAQLAAAGITSFAALADASPEQLAGIIKAPAWQKLDFAAWIAEARVWKQQPRAAGDDLLRIEGIGPVYAAKLRTAGITTFAQLAATDEAPLSEIIQAPAWRQVNYGEWREQARLAAAGDEAGLKALQDRLFARGKNKR